MPLKRPRRGDLRHTLLVERRKVGVALDSHGQKTTTWESFGPPARAAIERLRGEEAEFARKLYPRATHKVTMDHRAGMREEHRLRFGTRIFEIGSIDNVDERGIVDVLLCGELG